MARGLPRYHWTELRTGTETIEEEKGGQKGIGLRKASADSQGGARHLGAKARLPGPPLRNCGARGGATWLLLAGGGQAKVRRGSADTVRGAVLNSRSAWAVEFFASWCGHCIAFAPTWKALANDVKDWRPALNLAALDCADETNSKVCRDFNIPGFPSVRFFKAFSKNGLGTTLPVAGANVQTLRERLIDALESHHDTWPPACPPLEPAKLEEIDGVFARNNEEYLALIFEHEGSYLGREVTLDLSQHQGLAVRRVLNTEGNVVSKFGVTDFPSCYLLFRNGSVSRVPVHLLIDKHWAGTAEWKAMLPDASSPGASHHTAAGLGISASRWPDPGVLSQFVQTVALLESEQVAGFFGPAAFPGGGAILGWYQRGFLQCVQLKESRSFYTAYLQRLSGLTRESTPTTAVPTTPDKIAPTVWKFADHPCLVANAPFSSAFLWVLSSKIYMADLESALHYILRVEVGKFSVLEGERLVALKKFVAVLAKYFPGQPFVQNFLHSINDWLKRQQRKKIPYSFFKSALDSRKEDAVLTKKVNWIGCQGSEPHFRGFPCSLWVLFHFLTVQASQQSADHSQDPANGQEGLQAIPNYVQFFFGCRDCANHFEQMAAGSMNRVRSPNDAVLWLWTSHNRVNARLAGAPSEDPQFPKIQWPPHELCSACHNELSGEPVWDVGATLRFLKAHFSPGNIVLHSPSSGPAPRSSAHSLAAAPNLGVGALGLAIRNSALGPEQADSTESPGNTSVPDTLAERPETDGPQVLSTGPVPRQGLPEHTTEPQRAVLVQPEGQRHLSKRDTGAVLLAESWVEENHFHGPSELRQGIRSSKQLASIPEREPEAQAVRGRGQWLQVLGRDFSHLDISLFVGLYSLSFMGLLGMYTYFRARMKVLKGHGIHLAA
ncbi:Sulfhydryl oxidase 1 [Heterocephalus glaber]|uniref:Sulfhydryl oxidase n=1 Tax=Heterocephalus glaber TaxID=10181 RepID=G5AYL7_HETGA|nr:Sulfhydryl oxidase 1 [Heterocephalus glaber]